MNPYRGATLGYGWHEEEINELEECAIEILKELLNEIFDY